MIYLAILLISITIIFCIVEFNVKYTKNKNVSKHENSNKNTNYVKPKLKELTQEQIDDIHARGKITPQEKVKEWEGMDLCAPGDAIGSAAWRCRKFHYNCHDCLVDYANEHDEYTSFKDIMKLIRPYNIN